MTKIFLILHFCERKYTSVDEISMIAYKLFRKLKDNSIAPLFINKRLRLKENVWYDAELHPTNGFAIRRGWHVLAKKHAPHLSKKGRVWRKVEIKNYIEYNRPKCQGGKWFLAEKMKVLGEVK